MSDPVPSGPAGPDLVRAALDRLRLDLEAFRPTSPASVREVEAIIQRLDDELTAISRTVASDVVTARVRAAVERFRVRVRATVRLLHDEVIDTFNLSPAAVDREMLKYAQVFEDAAREKVAAPRPGRISPWARLVASLLFLVASGMSFAVPGMAPVVTFLAALWGWVEGVSHGVASVWEVRDGSPPPADYR